MTTIRYSRGAAASSGAPSHAMARKRKPYKIVLESVTEEKRKLRSTVSYSAQAPPGYTFVPAGIPELSEFCKESCRKRGRVVHVVSAAPKSKAHIDPEKISHHIHRIGHHFPNDVVDLACDWLGYTTRNGIYEKNVDVAQTSRIAKALEKHRKQTSREDDSNNEQETREQITAAIRDLFPKIPEKDLKAIVKHAFREGTGRVGNAADLSLPRRVQLAVVAHIRHVYTDYDNLLKTGSYLEARAKVEQICLERLVKWRGEEKDADGVVELEDTFREFIVIDDSDDDDDSETESSAGDVDERFPSVEITTTQVTATDLQPESYPPLHNRPTPSTYRGGRRAILVSYPPDHLVARSYPASTVVHPAIREVNPPASSTLRAEPSWGTYVFPNAGDYIREMDRQAVIYPPPAQDYRRSQLVSFEGSRPVYRYYDQERLLYEDRQRMYTYGDNLGVTSRYVEEIPHVYSTREHPSQREWREPGRHDEVDALTHQENERLYAPHGRYERTRDPVPNDRDTVLPSIEGTGNTEPLRAFPGSRPSSPPQFVQHHTRNGAVYGRDGDSQPKQHTRHNFPAVAESSGYGHSYSSSHFDSAAELADATRKPLSSPFEAVNSAREGQFRRPRVVFRRSGMDPVEYDAASYKPNMGSHVEHIPHDAAFVSPNDIVDLASGQRKCPENRSHRIHFDDGYHRTLNLTESRLTRLGDPMSGAVEHSFDKTSHRRGNSNPTYSSANSQWTSNDTGTAPHIPGTWRGLKGPLDHPNRCPPTLQFQAHPQHSETHRNSSTRMETQDSRNPGTQANTDPLSPLPKPRAEPIVIDDSPPRKKRRQVTDSKSKQILNVSRQAVNSNNRTTPRHRPVDLDDPQHLSRRVLGHSRGERSGTHANPDQLCDLY